jgi:hypothetical protein
VTPPRREENVTWEVLEQEPGVMAEDLVPEGIDWVVVAKSLNRPVRGVNKVYMEWIHPTVRRHLQGTLERDIRGELVRQVVAEGHVYCTDIDFAELAGRIEFRGHNRASLQRLYHDLMLGVLVRGGGGERRRVTAGQVEDYWAASGRAGKNRVQEGRERAIVEAYSSLNP